MNPFKIGDEVRFADNAINRVNTGMLEADGFVIGDYATITFVDGYFVYVDNNGPYFPSRFELVDGNELFPSTEGDYIVAVIDEGAYAPSRTPKVFRSEAQALKVAEKMSKKHDAEFAVFQRIAVATPEGLDIDPFAY